MYETVVSIWIVLYLSAIAYAIYKRELGKYESKKDFWKLKTQMSMTGPKEIFWLIIWDMILIISIPAGIIWRFTTWMMKSSKS